MALERKIFFYFLLLSLGIFTQVNSLFAQENVSLLFTNDFFTENKALDITLEVDLKKFIKEKMNEKYEPASLSYFTEDSIKIKKHVKIKSRGKFRLDYCYFPPFFINIKNADLNDSLTGDFNKIKVVSQCKSSEAYYNYLIKEYIAYKLMNIITDYSFRVRLLNLKYVDTGRDNKELDFIAFMIEPEKLLAERLAALPLEMDNFSYGQTDEEITTVMSLFQYMIANTDYSITGRHNIKLITLKDHTKKSIIPIPYDFDYSGLVNTFYAVPQTNLSIKYVTQRYFFGISRNEEVYLKALQIFHDKKEEILSFVNSCDYLDDKIKKQIIKFLERFFKEIEDPNFIEMKLYPKRNNS